MKENYDVIFQDKSKGHYTVMFEGRSFAEVEMQAIAFLGEENLSDQIIKIERDWHD
jgi:hypothetical protein